LKAQLVPHELDDLARQHQANPRSRGLGGVERNKCIVGLSKPTVVFDTEDTSFSVLCSTMTSGFAAASIAWICSWLPQCIGMMLINICSSWIAVAISSTFGPLTTVIEAEFPVPQLWVTSGGSAVCRKTGDGICAN